MWKAVTLEAKGKIASDKDIESEEEEDTDSFCFCSPLLEVSDDATLYASSRTSSICGLKYVQWELEVGTQTLS